MPERSYSYIIIGGGLAGAAAVEGIRQHDAGGSILLISAEHDAPYDRPPLSIGLKLAREFSKIAQLAFEENDPSMKGRRKPSFPKGPGTSATSTILGQQNRAAPHGVKGKTVATT